MIISNLSLISHRLATIHLLDTTTTTDGRADGRQPFQRRLQHNCSASKIESFNV